MGILNGYCLNNTRYSRFLFHCPASVEIPGCLDNIHYEVPGY